MFWIMYHNASSEALSREIHNDSPWCCLVCGQPVGRRFETSAGYFARLAAGIVDALPFQHRRRRSRPPRGRIPVPRSVRIAAALLHLDRGVLGPAPAVLDRDADRGRTRRGIVWRELFQLAPVSIPVVVQI